MNLLHGPRGIVKSMAVILILGMLLSAVDSPLRLAHLQPKPRLLKRRRRAVRRSLAETLVYGGDFTDLITLDPAVVYEFGGTLIVGNVYETLVSFNPGDPTLIPVLAESWDVTEEGDNWLLTFNLDSDATFASGNPVTAEDVVFLEPRHRHQPVAGLPAHRRLRHDHRKHDRRRRALRSSCAFLKLSARRSATVGAHLHHRRRHRKSRTRTEHG